MENHNYYINGNLHGYAKYSGSIKWQYKDNSDFGNSTNGGEYVSKGKNDIAISGYGRKTV